MNTFKWQGNFPATFFCGDMERQKLTGPDSLGAGWMAVQLSWKETFGEGKK
jgi:hypothetical protein